MDKDKREWFEHLANGGGGDFTDEHCELAKDALTEIASLTAKLAAADKLVAKWRAEAAKYEPSTVELIAGGVGCMKICADELESILGGKP
jgi:hypothetical protein